MAHVLLRLLALNCLGKTGFAFEGYFTISRGRWSGCHYLRLRMLAQFFHVSQCGVLHAEGFCRFRQP